MRNGTLPGNIAAIAQAIIDARVDAAASLDGNPNNALIISSGSLETVTETVTVLVEGGATLTTPDTAFHGTPLGWALYALSDSEPRRDSDADFRSIVDYLQSRERAH